MATNTEAIGKSLAMLTGMYRIELDDFGAEAYHIALEDLTPAQINLGTRAVIKSPDIKFMPTPGQLRELCVAGPGGSAAMADQAWDVLGRAIQRHGADHSVNFRDALINATVKMLGGWDRCCTIPIEEFEKWYKRDFVATYLRLLQSGCTEEQGRYLVGRYEIENARWVGRTDWGKGDKVYELPAPEEVGCEYTPALLSAPNQTPALNHRPDNVPRLELKKATT